MDHAVAIGQLKTHQSFSHVMNLMSQVLAQRGVSRADSSDVFKPLIIVLDPPRATLHERIAHRSALMVRQGLVDEVRSLLASGVDPACKSMRSIGYQQVVSLLGGTLSAEQLEEQIVYATRQYAKRQTTWFRKVETFWRLSVPELSSLQF